MIKFVFLSTDLALFGLCLALLIYGFYVHQTPPLAAQWRRVFQQPIGMVCAVLLSALLLLACIDSVHYRPALPVFAPTSTPTAAIAYAPQTLSLLDAALLHLKNGQEKTYSQPLHSTQWLKETSLTFNQDKHVVPLRDNPPLVFGGAHLRRLGQRGDINTAILWNDVAYRAIQGSIIGTLLAGGLVLLWTAIILQQKGLQFAQAKTYFKQTKLPWRYGFIALMSLSMVSGMLWKISLGWHVFGTDRSGNDVLFLALKSVRTALMIGIITTLASLPFGLVLGIVAGTLRGWVDSLVQYVYTVLSSIPGVLLIAPCVLMIQAYVDNHLEQYATALERADVKLLALCVVLGVTSWASLARLLRAQAMQLREMEFVLAARSFGVPTWRVMTRHILPNTLHLLILTVAMEFSSLVLYEAVLSYIGIGVDPAIQSFGGMINAGRTELARTPMIAWPLLSAFGFMLLMVLTANLFADCVRNAFDPKYVA